MIKLPIISRLLPHSFFNPKSTENLCLLDFHLCPIQRVTFGNVVNYNSKNKLPFNFRDSHIKVMGILIVSLRGVKCRLWSRLRCLGREVAAICPFRYRSGLCINKFTKQCRDTDHTKISSLVSLLSWATDTLVIPYGFNFNFPTSIPVTFIGEYPRDRTPYHLPLFTIEMLQLIYRAENEYYMRSRALYSMKY